MRLSVCLLLVPGVLSAIQQSGSVRAADQFIPGATVTARQGGAKVVAYTDETGRYTLDLTPGAWDLEVDMFGFRPQAQRLEVGMEPTWIDWTLEMPRAGDPPAAAPVTPPVAPAKSAAANAPAPAPGPAASGTTVRQSAATPQARAARAQAAGRGGRGPGFQNVAVQATEQGREEAVSAPPVEDPGGDTADAFTIRGSDSGGLAEAADEQTRRDRQAARGGAGGNGRGGAGSLSEMAALGAGAPGAGDGMGLNGFGAAGVQGGFG
ncbi:MAG: carboxypeptidase regulatory-like domain-containing protein, partial [Acidobacteria bacterium]|nr:carboxypeptidase regulatory-like domain-containing protein [Acidobacteriota bacterium]